MQLQELFDYKNQLMEDILTNEQIVKLIDPDLDFSEAESLAYSRVFPYEYIPTTAEHGVTYLCFDVDIQKSLNQLIYLPTISVWVFTHKSKMRLPDGGGVRTDRICAEIAKVLEGSRMYGFNELSLYSVKRFAPMTDYNGKIMLFNAKDVKLTHPTGKPLPANRRAGV